MTGGSALFHPPAGEDKRSRDVFPLPQVASTPITKPGLSRGTRRRLLTKAAFNERVNMALRALNSMYFGEKATMRAKSVDDLSGLPLVQRDCILNVQKHVKLLGPPPMDARCQGAFAALRAASSSYHDIEPGVGDVVEMDIKQLSLPSGKVAGVCLGQNLCGAVKEMVENFDSFMLQDASVWTDLEAESIRIKPYNDASLKDRSAYLEFVSHLFRCGVLSFTTEVRGRVGAFCVSKKPKMVDGKLVPRQRLVLDCRSVNLQFRDPPRTELGSLSSLADTTLPEGETLYIATADICDCFYACDCPPGLEQYFCLCGDITADEARRVANGCWDGDFSVSSTWSPCFKVLPMGFNWSFYLVQALHEQAAMDALGVSRDAVFLDGHPSPVLSKGSATTMPYCDNVHVLSLSPDICQTGKEAVCEKLEHMGFVLHEHTSASSYTQTLGGIVDGDIGHIRCSERRIWSLIFAFEYAATHKISTELMQRLLGHAMVVCTINRCGMAIFRRLYDFVHSGCGPRKLNFSEKRECLVFAGLLPLLVADIRRPWSDNVTATDASPEGWGICERHLPPDVVQNCGKWHERWRFRRLDAAEWKPRERALKRDVFNDFLTVKGTLDQMDDFNNYVPDDSFPEVQSDVLSPEEWMTVGMGKWRDNTEHITLKEARAVLLAVRRLSRASRHRHRRHLLLVDNMALCFSLGKGRSSNFAILRVLQQIGSVCLACSISLRSRWIPSELNISDGPSRGQIAPGPYVKVSKGVSDEVSQSNCCSSPIANKQEDESCFQSSANLSKFSKQEGWPHQSAASVPAQAPSPARTKANHPQGQACGQLWCWKKSNPKEAYHPGTEECQLRGETAVCGVPPEVRGLLQGERIPLASRFKSDRPSPNRLLGHPLPRQSLLSRRRKDVGRSGVRNDPVERSASQGQKGPQRMAKRDAATVKASSPAPLYVWNRNAAFCARVHRHESESGHRFFPISSSRRRPRHQGAKCDPTFQGCWHPIPLGECRDPRHGGRKARQSRHLRQQHPARFETHKVDWGPVAEKGENVEQSGQSDLHVLHGRVPGAVCEGSVSDGAAPIASISAPPWRRNRRADRQSERVQPSQIPGPLENRQVSEEVRQDWACPAVAGKNVQTGHPVLPVVGKELRASVSWHEGRTESDRLLSWDDIFTMHGRPKRFCLELFAGSARISQALKRLGVPIFPVDICLFPSHNVLHSNICKGIFNFLRQQRVKLVWIGMPCTTFSRARQFDGLGPPPLRTSDAIWGLSDLRPSDCRKLNEGNQLFNFTMKILHLCEQYKIPYVLENPLTSMAWEMPPMMHFMETFRPALCDLDFCMYGEAWQKPTRLLSNYIDIADLSFRCMGSHLRCSRSKRPHRALKGTDSNGVFWTLRAQPYPWQLAQKFAALAATALSDTWR